MYYIHSHAEGGPDQGTGSQPRHASGRASDDTVDSPVEGSAHQFLALTGRQWFRIAVPNIRICIAFYSPIDPDHEITDLQFRHLFRPSSHSLADVGRQKTGNRAPHLAQVPHKNL
jgi:hypothetical protein